VVTPDPQGTDTNAAMPAVGLTWRSMAPAPLGCGERRWTAVGAVEEQLAVVALAWSYQLAKVSCSIAGA
jgi:hypothetical protein